MKPSAVLVNTGRGELVDEDDLVTALREGLIRYAALDVYGAFNVFAPEGFATDHPLFGLPNALLTPHVSAYSEEALTEQRQGGAQAVVDVLTGKWPAHPVNPDVKPWFDITPQETTP
jgi:phosphoglycerate dehydrogenase-like enzyme